MRVATSNFFTFVAAESSLGGWLLRAKGDNSCISGCGKSWVLPRDRWVVEAMGTAEYARMGSWSTHGIATTGARVMLGG